MKEKRHRHTQEKEEVTNMPDSFTGLYHFVAHRNKPRGPVPEAPEIATVKGYAGKAKI